MASLLTRSLTPALRTRIRLFNQTIHSNVYPKQSSRFHRSVPTMASSINEHAQSGFAKSQAYDDHRPTYSPTAVSLLLEKVRIAGQPGLDVLDLASGTGKFTELLADREEKYNVVAVEPHDSMRQVLADKNISNVRVEAGSATSIPLPDHSADAIIIAQAFHWFATKEALQELHRVVKRHGCLGLIWNIDDYNAPRSYKPKTSWERKAHDLIWTFDDNEPRFRHEKWRQVFDDQIKSTPLSLIKANDQYWSLPLGEHQEEYQVWLSKEQVWERYNTLSQIASLEGDARERTHQKFMEALNADDVEVNDKGQVAVHGNTYIFWSSKIPEEGRENLTSVEKSAA